jgi:tripeptide aminopeptidase
MINKNLINSFLETASIESLSGNEKPIASFIKSILTSYNLNIFEDSSKEKTGSDTGNIICKVGTGGDFLLSCHMDTARSTKNMKPIIHEDRITSDGTTVLGVDNRVGVTILLELIKKITNEKIPHKDFTLVFTTCEETTLAGSLNLEVSEEIKRAFVFDSYMSPGKYIAASVGAAGYKVKVIGKAAHSGIAPEKGINALTITAEAISKIKFGKIDNETTSNIGIIRGGTATNVIPDLIELEGEVRSRDTESVKKNVEIIKCVFENACAQFNGKLDFQWYWDFMPFNLCEKSKVVYDLEEAIRRSNLVPEQVLSYGGSDANSYNGRGIEAVNIGIGAQNPHSNSEFIFLEDLDKAFQIALELVKK